MRSDQHGDFDGTNLRPTVITVGSSCSEPHKAAKAYLFARENKQKRAR